MTRIELTTGVLLVLVAFACCSLRVEQYSASGFDETNQIDAEANFNSEKIRFQPKEVNVADDSEAAAAKSHHRAHKNKNNRPRVGHRQLMQNGMQQGPNGYTNGNNNNNINNNNNNNNNYNNGGGNPRSIRQQRVVNLPDNWDKIPYIMQTYNKPEQSYLMPALSNGFIGTTAFNDSLYMNGLYNGVQEKSHRLRIPSLAAVEAYFPLTDDEDIIQYHFNCRHGLFTIKTRDNQAEINQHFYVHRRFKNLIVNEIRVELLRGVPVIIELYNSTKLNLNMAYVNIPSNPNGYSYYFQDQNPENVSFEQRVIKQPTYLTNRRTELNDGIYHLAATIPQTEIPNKRQKQIHTFYTNVPSRITAYANRTFQIFHFLQTVDSDSFRARGAYEDALRMIQQDPNSLLVSHTSAWEEVWSKNGMAAIADTTYSDQNQEIFKLSQRMYASFYNLYASLPFTFDSQFYGLSPAGLAYGGLRAEYLNNSMIPNNRQLAEGYGGHVMYHQELFVLPLMSMFSQDMSRSIINSRLRRGLNTDHMNMYEQARELAKQEGFVGLRYPWEQADYGVDVSPFADARKSKLHVSADISFGIRSYLRATHSREFLQQSVSPDVSLRGEEYLNEIAKYWSDRFEIEPTTNKYEIKRVSFGERSQPNEVNNEAFTNYIGTMAMSAYKYAIYLSDRNPYDPQYEVTVREYDDKINRAQIPYDSFRQLYLEYDNFNSQQHEETWAPFLNFPLQKDITYAQKKILYDNYASRLPSDGRNMQSFASFLVGHIELNEDAKARDYLNRMYPYFAGSFLVATEFPQTTSAINPQNTFNYLPSYAAFATAFIAGYCGVRYRDFQLDLVYPSEFFGQYQAQGSSQYPVFTQPAPNVEVWNVTGLLYRGNKIDIIYSLRARSVEIRNRRPTDQFIIPDDTLEIAIYEGTERVVKPLRVGDSVQISLTTESWVYAPKKSRLQKRNSYSDNMHILASIYSTQMNRYVVRPSSSSKMAGLSSFFYICVLSISLLFTKYSAY